MKLRARIDRLRAAAERYTAFQRRWNRCGPFSATPGHWAAAYVRRMDLLGLVNSPARRSLILPPVSSVRISRAGNMVDLLTDVCQPKETQQ